MSFDYDFICDLTHQMLEFIALHIYNPAPFDVIKMVGHLPTSFHLADSMTSQNSALGLDVTL